MSDMVYREETINVAGSGPIITKDNVVQEHLKTFKKMLRCYIDCSAELIEDTECQFGKEKAQELKQAIKEIK